MPPPPSPEVSTPLPPCLPTLAADGGGHWLAEMGRRARHHFWLKTIGVTAFTSLFFIAYFHILRNPSGPVFEMPLTALDHAIPFQPGWLPAYLTLWFYVGIPPGMFLDLRRVIVYGAWAAALCLSGLAVFHVWPNAVPPPGVQVDLAQYPAFALLQGVDAAGNACPSLHVATAVFTAIWLHRALPLLGGGMGARAINGLWCMLIVYSTVAIRQHVVWDVVAGAALGAAFAAAAARWVQVDPRPR